MWSHHVKEISIPAATRTECWGVPHILSVRARGWPGGGDSLLSFPSREHRVASVRLCIVHNLILCDQILSVYKGVGVNEDETKWGMCGGQDSALTFPFTLASKWETHQIGYRTT